MWPFLALDAASLVFENPDSATSCRSDLLGLNDTLYPLLSQQLLKSTGETKSWH